jgi:phage gp46-like protein
MSDLRTVFIDFSQGADLVLDRALLGDDDGLLTAVLLSLFSDRQARPDDVLPNADHADDDRRGWWGDDLNDDVSDRIGSRLWLNQSAKALPQVLVRDREYALEALQWMIDDGIASRIEIHALSPRPGIRAIVANIHRPDQPVARYQFEHFWERRNGL